MTNPLPLDHSLPWVGHPRTQVAPRLGPSGIFELWPFPDVSRHYPLLLKCVILAENHKGRVVLVNYSGAFCSLDLVTQLVGAAPAAFGLVAVIKHAVRCLVEALVPLVYRVLVLNLVVEFLPGNRLQARLRY